MSPEPVADRFAARGPPRRLVARAGAAAAQRKPIQTGQPEDTLAAQSVRMRTSPGRQVFDADNHRVFRKIGYPMRACSAERCRSELVGLAYSRSPTKTARTVLNLTRNHTLVHSTRRLN